MQDATSFAGGIGNTGTISTKNDGVLVGAVTTFSGGISNGGRISALGNALDAQDVARFGGYQQPRYDLGN